MIKNKLSNFTTWALFLASLFMMLGMFTPQLAAAKSPIEDPNTPCGKLYKAFEFTSYINGQTATSNAVAGLPPFCSASQIIDFVIHLILYFAGTITVLFVIIGGFLFLTSAGNEEQAEKGRKILVNAVIGLVVIIMAFAIVQIIGGLLTSGAKSTSTPPTTQTPPANLPPSNQPPANPPPGEVSVDYRISVATNDNYSFSATGPASLLTCGANSSAVSASVAQGSGEFKTVSASSFANNNGNFSATFSIGSPKSLGYIVTNQTQTKNIHIKVSVCGTVQTEFDVSVLSAFEPKGEEPNLCLANPCAVGCRSNECLTNPSAPGCPTCPSN